MLRNIHLKEMSIKLCIMKSITLIIEMYLCLFIIVVFIITINMYAIIKN